MVVLVVVLALVRLLAQRLYRFVLGYSFCFGSLSGFSGTFRTLSGHSLWGQNGRFFQVPAAEVQASRAERLMSFLG